MGNRYGVPRFIKNNNNKDIPMKEIRFNIISHHLILIFEICMLALGYFLIVYFIHSLTTAKDSRTIMLGSIMPVFCLLIVKSAFIDVMFYVRFYGLRIKPLDDKMILIIHDKECLIPTSKDVSIINCMRGWLIIWPSGTKRKMILIRKDYFGTTRRQELDKYFELNMNYIASKKEKKRLLKSLHINVFNPLKYIKWPD
jgi:hypothetical protein